MNIYIDYIFLENLFINFIVSIQVSIFCKFKIFSIRYFIGLILIAVYSVLICINDYSILNNILVKMLMLFSLTYITYHPKNLRVHIKVFLVYIMFYAINASIIIFITIFFKINLKKLINKVIIYLLAGIILTLSNKYMWKMWKINIKNKIIFYIKFGENIFKAFVDTGNNVKDIKTGFDVIFISRKNEEKIVKSGKLEKTSIYISTACSSDRVTGYIVEDVIIFDNRNAVNINKVIVVFIDENLFKNKNYEGLISYDLYLDKLKGVTL